MQQGVELLTAQLGADQAVADQFEITAELRDFGVVKSFLAWQAVLNRTVAELLRCLPPGLSHLVVAGERALKPLQDVAEFQPIGLQPIARSTLFVNLRKPQPVHFQRFQQRRSNLAPLHGNAQLVAQRLNGADVELQHQLTLVTGRSPGDGWGDRGIPVPI
ncbi:MAG: Uncharacterised protein [Synechococcus sp. CC9902]|nr:MAG: Uncharacterised protein [Synechococcus sp. CC9902]